MPRQATKDTAVNEERPGPTLEHATFESLLRIANQLTQGLAELLRPHGITPTQYNLLRILQSGAPLACGEMGERMITRDPDITRLGDRLEKQGLIRRARSVEDRRVVVTEITEEGRRLVNELEAPVAKLHEAQLGRLGGEKLRTLAELLRQAQETLE